MNLISCDYFFVILQAELRVASGRLPGEAPTHYISNQPEHAAAFPPHYITGNIANHLVHPSSPSLGLRHEKIILDGKSSQTPEPRGPAIVSVVDRPPSHNIPPHLSSPHTSEQRITDSPSVGAVFPGQRQIYATSGLPQQQHPTSQAISNMYAHAEIDGRYSHSPSFLYDNSSRAAAAAAAAAAAMEQERERPKGTASPSDPPYRIRSPLSLVSNDGLQGDSLLHLLQVCICSNLSIPFMIA